MAEAKLREVDNQLQIEVDLNEINEYFICKVCKGYYREAHTIAECLHTFCKSCIIQRFKQQQECPQCFTKTTIGMIRPDHNIQSLLSKLYPEVEEKDEELEKEFMKDFPIEYQKQQELLLQQQKITKGNKKSLVSSTTGNQSKKAKNSTIETSPQQKTTTTQQPRAVASGKIRLTLEPKNPDYSLDKPYIEASGGIKVESMKNYIAEKFGILGRRVVLSLKGEELPNDHSIEFIQKTKWSDPGMSMVWTFDVLSE